MTHDMQKKIVGTQSYLVIYDNDNFLCDHYLLMQPFKKWGKLEQGKYETLLHFYDILLN